MKTISFPTVIFCLTVFMITLSSTVFAKKNIIRKGGTPGQESNWYCPKNWSTYSVPDELSNVSIPNVSSTTLASPVIESGKVEINSLFIESNAFLEIAPTAKLIVFGNVEGMIKDNLKVDGSLILLNELEPQNATTEKSHNKKDY